MAETKRVSPMVIRRLPRYHRYLSDLLLAGKTRVSSHELSEKMKASASQIRQDLNCFGGFGQQGYGYNVEYLHSEISKILGLKKQRSMVIIGAGNLGKSIAGYGNFAKRGFILRGLFDINPDIVGTKAGGVEIKHISELFDFVNKYDIEIGVLTLPKEFAQETADILIRAGIKGIWNFSHTDIEAPQSVMLENVHLSDSLMTLSCKMEQQEKA